MHWVGGGLINVINISSYQGGGGADANFFLLLDGSFFLTLAGTDFLLL